MAASLSARGLENYCPLNKVRRRWSDRYKVILEPLFKGYVFVRLNPETKWEARQVPGIINFLHYNKHPALVRDEEIDTIRKFLNEFDNVEVADVEKGAAVRVKQGVLMNYHGIVLTRQGNKASVLIESMGLQLTATFDLANLEKMQEGQA